LQFETHVFKCKARIPITSIIGINKGICISKATKTKAQGQYEETGEHNERRYKVQKEYGFLFYEQNDLRNSMGEGVLYVEVAYP